MNKIFKMGIVLLTAMMLWGCTEAQAANAPELETSTITTTVISETTASTSETTTSTSTTTSISSTSTTTSTEATITKLMTSGKTNETSPVAEEKSDNPAPAETITETKTETIIEAEPETASPTESGVFVVYKPTSEVAVTTTGISDSDYTLLCKIVASEYGGMADVYERAKIVASVMNQVKDPRFPNTVEAVLDRSCAPWGFNKYAEYFCGNSVHYSSMSDAVDYYFNNPDLFANWTCNSWQADGKGKNDFYTV